MVEETNPIFNSGTATLMRIDEILRTIHRLRVNTSTNWVEKYIYVYRSCEDLLNLSAPLIEEENYEKLSSDLYKIPSRVEKIKKEYSREREDEIAMNKIIAKVQFILQEKGYLMPHKKSSNESVIK
jgi:hypothetical protein